MSIYNENSAPIGDFGFRPGIRASPWPGRLPISFRLKMFARASTAWGGRSSPVLKVEEFRVEVLGVLENLGPRQSIILARLSGGPLANTGVMQGMSGSPVYIDGKLLGAVALSFPLSKEAIAGIRPIEDMLHVTPQPPQQMSRQPRSAGVRSSRGTRVWKKSPRRFRFTGCRQPPWSILRRSFANWASTRVKAYRGAAPSPTVLAIRASWSPAP